MASANSASGTSDGKQPTIICVFCGSSPGSSPAYLEAARELARIFHKNNITLVYGGGTVGLMGELASTLVSLSGPAAVRGIIPKALVKYEQAYPEPTSTSNPKEQDAVSIAASAQSLETSAQWADDPVVTKTVQSVKFGQWAIVKTMHERKDLMTKQIKKGGPGSGFVALSGGLGTMEELLEVATWHQLGIHDKGIVAFNVEGMWNGLVQLIGDSVKAGFVKEELGGIIQFRDSAEGCVEALRNYEVAKARFNLDWGEK